MNFLPRLTLTAGIALAVLAGPARAQFGNIFAPPRPPANVPNETIIEEEAPPELPPGRVLPIPARPSNAPVQREALPPLPGAANAPSAPQPLNPPSAPAAPRQQQAKPAPASTAPQPGDEIVTEPPTQRVVNATAVFDGLDKITGRIISFEATINETVQFGALQITARACYTRPATDQQNTDGFVEVNEITLQGEVKRIFTGWMFAASPGLHAVEHPIYDVWLKDCKTPTATVATNAPDPAAAKPAQPNAQRRQPAQPRTVQPRAPAPPVGSVPVAPPNPFVNR